MSQGSGIIGSRWKTHHVTQIVIIKVTEEDLESQIKTSHFLIYRTCCRKSFTYMLQAIKYNYHYLEFFIFNGSAESKILVLIRLRREIDSSIRSVSLVGTQTSIRLHANKICTIITVNITLKNKINANQPLANLKYCRSKLLRDCS